VINSVNAINGAVFITTVFFSIRVTA
jgi:hypothetical protein